MTGPLAPTARSGRSRSGADQLASALGWFSIGLGTLEIAAPRALCRVAGLQGHESLVRAYGARELATGVAILTSHSPEPWIWGRVAGDAIDIATVASAGRSDGEGNVGLTLCALAGVTLLDALCASALKGEKGTRTTEVADYSDRSGFPKGVAWAREAGARSAAPRGSGSPVTGGALADRAAEAAPGPAGARRESAAERQERLLDEAIEETFPASDPISPKSIT